MYHFPFLFLANKLQTFAPLINYSPIVYNQLIGVLCTIFLCYKVYTLLFKQVYCLTFLVFLVIHGYLSSLFTLCCGIAKPDVTFPAKKIHLVKSSRSHVKWYETLRFCIGSVMKRGENTCAKRKPKECSAQ